MDPKSLLDALREAVSEGRAPGTAERLTLAVTEDPAVVRRAGTLLKGLAPDTAGLRPVRVALHGTGTLGAFPHLLRASLVGGGMCPDIRTGEYGRFEMELATGAFAAPHGAGDADPGALPDAIVCLLSEEFFLPPVPEGRDIKEVTGHVENRLTELLGLVRSALGRTGATLVLHTVPLSRPVRNSFISVRDRAALARTWHRLNAELLGLSAQESRVLCVDFDGALAHLPATARDNRLHRYADMPYTDSALLLLAQEVRRILQAKSGLSRKVLALDADNTLWGGVLGEVGAHGVQLGGLYPGNSYLALQQAASALRAQGVVLVLASKNDAEPVNEILTEHPDVQLRPDAFSVLAANWGAKAENLRAAAASLGLSTDAFVFMDDSPYEREHVRAELPEIAVVAADGDPAHLSDTLLRQGWFDVLELTEADHRRPALYRSRALRSEYSGEFTSSDDYLRALDIRLTAAEATAFTTGRIAQLAARTNQFNLTNIRFDEAATHTMRESAGHLVACFAVEDRFGDEGPVGAAWVECGAEEWRVLNLVLSCRVLGRGVELAVTDWIFGRAAAAGARWITADFVPSAKNGMAADTWERAGLLPVDDAASDGTRSFACAVDALRPAAPDWITLTSRKKEDER
ncbi:HAD-IIIC family phosphatase [Streptomyces sp. NPDC096354]|uniref:HAD-IIIC family phosphatase n=1 Tax=Streptomyces sp. NPDC096354 TaxID=3366088 RepID=UPI00380E1A3F